MKAQGNRKQLKPAEALSSRGARLLEEGGLRHHSSYDVHDFPTPIVPATSCKNILSARNSPSFSIKTSRIADSRVCNDRKRVVREMRSSLNGPSCPFCIPGREERSIEAADFIERFSIYCHIRGRREVRSGHKTLLAQPAQSVLQVVIDIGAVLRNQFDLASGYCSCGGLEQAGMFAKPGNCRLTVGVRERHNLADRVKDPVVSRAIRTRSLLLKKPHAREFRCEKRSGNLRPVVHNHDFESIIRVGLAFKCAKAVTQTVVRIICWYDYGDMRQKI